MTTTQTDYQEAEHLHKVNSDLLIAQQGRLAYLEKELSDMRFDVDTLQKMVEMKRALVNELQAATDLASHRCLEIQAILEKQISAEHAAA